MSAARPALRAALSAGGVLATAIVGCLTYDATEIQDVGAMRESFSPVGEMLGARCGSLDCHGVAGRSMRLYHHFGLRLDPDDVPGGEETSEEEHDASFLSVTGLEPEDLADVVAHGGEGMEDLVLYGKAYGLMKHKGGTAILEGTNADRCFVTWLAGRVDVEACEGASTLSRPK